MSKATKLCGSSEFKITCCWTAYCCWVLVAGCDSVICNAHFVFSAHLTSARSHVYSATELIMTFDSGRSRTNHHTDNFYTHLNPPDSLFCYFIFVFKAVIRYNQFRAVAKKNDPAYVNRIVLIIVFLLINLKIYPFEHPK